MAQDFFEHYWDTVRWKEVAREARPVPAPVTTAGSEVSVASTYGGQPFSVVGVLVEWLKVGAMLVLMLLAVVGAFAVVGMSFGPLWGAAGAVFAYLMARWALYEWLG